MALLTEEIAQAFVACLEEERYYDAHEVLEGLWYPRRFDKTPEILLLKGMINASVSFELVKRGRREAAEKPWRTYLKYRVLLREALDTPPHRRIERTVAEHAARLLGRTAEKKSYFASSPEENR